jgi:hypothetical protein
MRTTHIITGIMTPKFAGGDWPSLYVGEQSIQVTTEPNGIVFINGVFGCSKDYPSYDAAIADIQHRHGFTFKPFDTAGEL